MPKLSVVHGESGQGEKAPSLPVAHTKLIGLSVDGDRSAIGELLSLVGPGMLCAIRTVLGVRAGDAEDVFQESLLALISALPSFRMECSLKHFACRIAARTAVRAVRKVRADEERLMTLTARESTLRRDPSSPRSQATAEQRKAILRQLLEELPEVQAETLVLRVILGYSLAEVAGATGVPINTVRSRVRLAKDALRKKIASDPRAAELLEVE